MAKIKFPQIYHTNVCAPPPPPLPPLYCGWILIHFTASYVWKMNPCLRILTVQLSLQWPTLLTMGTTTNRQKTDGITFPNYVQLYPHTCSCNRLLSDPLALLSRTHWPHVHWSIRAAVPLLVSPSSLGLVHLLARLLVQTPPAGPPCPASRRCCCRLSRCRPLGLLTPLRSRDNYQRKFSIYQFPHWLIIGAIILLVWAPVDTLLSVSLLRWLY